MSISEMLGAGGAKIYTQIEEGGPSLYVKFRANQTNGSPVMGRRLIKRKKLA